MHTLLRNWECVSFCLKGFDFAHHSACPLSLLKKETQPSPTPHYFIVYFLRKNSVYLEQIPQDNLQCRHIMTYENEWNALNIVPLLHRPVLPIYHNL